MELACTGPTWVCNRSSAYMLLWFACCFVELLTMGMDVSLTVWPTLETPFLLLGCRVQLQYVFFCLVLLYLVLSSLVVVS